MSQETLHDYLDRAERALSRIEAAMARKKAESATPAAGQRSDSELKLREEVTQVIVELDRLMADAEKTQ